jgi:hypothetical protein
MGQWPCNLGRFRRKLGQCHNSPINSTCNHGDSQKKFDCIGYHAGFLQEWPFFSRILPLCQTLALPLVANRLNGAKTVTLKPSQYEQEKQQRRT